MKKTIFVFLFILITSFLYAEKMRIAVLDFGVDGVPANTAKAFSDWLRTELINTQSYLIIERSAMDAIMKEQALSLTGCTDTTCAVEVGKILSARKMLIGTIQKYEGKFIVNARLIDVEKGVAEFAHKETYESLSNLDKDVWGFTQNLSAKVTGYTIPTTDTTAKQDFETRKSDKAIYDEKIILKKQTDFALSYEGDSDISSIIEIAKNYVIDGDMCYKKGDNKCAKKEYEQIISLLKTQLNIEQLIKIDPFIIGIKERLNKIK